MVRSHSIQGQSLGMEPASVAFQQQQAWLCSACPWGAGEVLALAAFCFAACIALSTVQEW